jgi:hypothetical protein
MSKKTELENEYQSEYEILDRVYNQGMAKGASLKAKEIFEDPDLIICLCSCSATTIDISLSNVHKKNCLYRILKKKHLGDEK